MRAFLDSVLDSITRNQEFPVLLAWMIGYLLLVAMGAWGGIVFIGGLLTKS